MQPGSRSRSRGGVGRTSLALAVPGNVGRATPPWPRSPARWSRDASSPTSPAPGRGPSPPARSSAAAGPLEEGPDGGRPADRPPGGLGHQLADDRRALPGDVPEPVPAARLVPARDRPEVPADRLRIPEPVRVVDERGHRLGRPGADPGMVRRGATAGVFRSRRFSSCSTRWTCLVGASISSRSRSRLSRCEAVGSSTRRTQASPAFVHRPGLFGTTTPAHRRSERAPFSARVRSATSWPRQLISSRHARTSVAGTCTAGVSPRSSSLAGGSTSLQSFSFFDRKISRSCPGWATTTLAADPTPHPPRRRATGGPRGTGRSRPARRGGQLVDRRQHRRRPQGAQ